MAKLEEQFFLRAGCQVTVAEMEQTDPVILQRVDGVVIATYTYTGGVIPPEAEDFFSDLEQLDLKGQQLVYGIVGTGEKYYGVNYNLAPDHFEAAFNKIGAIQGAPSIKIELSVQQADVPLFRDFSQSMLAKLKEVASV